MADELLTMEQVIAAIKRDPTLFEKIEKQKAEMSVGLPTYIRQGKNFALVEFETVGNVRGKPARICTLGQKTDRNGGEVVKQTRKKPDAAVAAVSNVTNRRK